MHKKSTEQREKFQDITIKPGFHKANFLPGQRPILSQNKAIIAEG